ncbi:preprotein translocase subunit SecG [Roseivirga sp.]|jgi:preprotein translocase subunit SecG|uniref:preprotein translocase subunit SecG n=1 Tax=Roseivirga sp. TaxID=1964215 RepID=UPI000D7B634E|nr:preprotein translocase subunit SecG [Roseivirga sp.]PWL32023.1 MAG: preprotein translocase subunit SecG [Roseivirga sp. XM-24bin3]MBO6495789.1 preprotein translocase subunit SecG [Roseivirga sp.]MBO6660164.1 preprotein translocase subunit SecG [Roseivirga sp.]MBO6760188.1 preprotein translocase subunit SecG [Roseivirga sp.]MBO6907099.1 preprotein translocase subunit SecG [Roseivirga sp.]
MFKLFIILAIIVAILLILIVLMQNSKGGGLSSQFGGGGAQQVIGVKKTTDILEKATWVFIIALIVFSLSSSLMLDKGTGNFVNPNVDAAQQSQGGSPIAPVDTTTDSTGSSIGTIPTDTTNQ